MIDQLREFINKSTPNINVGSLIINQNLEILAVSDVVTHWLNCQLESLIRQKLTSIFPEIADFERILKHMSVKNDRRLHMQITDITQAASPKARYQNFDFEAQSAPRPGFLLLTITASVNAPLPNRVEREIQERTAELAQANLLLQWENERLRKQQMNRPQTGPLGDPSRYFPQIGFSSR
ncbi:MAG: hypothetical protein KDE51_25235 [Anaerolineales bacterium]|nr:hypothetical protein [Anaerolineales bacterium]